MMSWHWCFSTSGGVAPLLLPPVWSTALCMATRQLACAECAASSWHMAAAAGAVVVVCSQMQKDGQANTSRSGTQAGMRQCYWQSSGDKSQSWQVLKSSSGREEQHACCVVTEALGRGLAGRWAFLVG